MTRRMWVLAVTAWVVVVIAGSALTWVAIDRAGGQVTGNPKAGQTQPVVVGTIGTAPTGTSTPKDKPSSKPTGTPTAEPTASASSTPPRPTRSHSPSAPTTSRAQSASTETRTWSGAAGTVTVSCTGRTVRLRGTSPSDGWHVEVGESSGEEVQVTFKREESEVQVQATCARGVPRFQAESDGLSGDR